MIESNNSLEAMITYSRKFEFQTSSKILFLSKQSKWNCSRSELALPKSLRGSVLNYVPRVPSALFVSCTYVHTCMCGCVAACLRTFTFYVPYVPSFFTCLMCFHFFTCLTYPHLFTCLTCLHFKCFQFLTCLMCLPLFKKAITNRSNLE